MAKLTVGVENDIPIELHYDVWGSGKPVVLIHGWPLSSRSWEAQVPALIGAGYQVVSYDRRGFGWSSQPWSGYDYETFTADLDQLITKLDLHGATLVGFSMGGGEVARYVGKVGTSRIAKVVFASAVAPCLYKTAQNPEGVMDDAAIDQLQGSVRTDRMSFLNGFTRSFFSAGDQLAVSEAQRLYAAEIAMFASPKGTVDCISAFARTDFREDLKKINLPALVIHGDSDAIVPLAASGQRTAASIPYCELRGDQGRAARSQRLEPQGVQRGAAEVPREEVTGEEPQHEKGARRRVRG
ncbi:MAG: alpha/beta hydrolase [Myxococcales bacterium]